MARGMCQAEVTSSQRSPGLGISEPLGQDGVLRRVARLALEDQAIAADAQIAQHHPGRIRLHRRLAQDLDRPAGEQDLGVGVAARQRRRLGHPLGGFVERVRAATLGDARILRRRRG